MNNDNNLNQDLILEICKEIFLKNDIKAIIFDNNGKIFLQNLLTERAYTLNDLKKYFIEDSWDFIQNFIKSNLKNSIYDKNNLKFQINHFIANIFYIEIIEDETPNISYIITLFKEIQTYLESNTQDMNYTLINIQNKYIPILNDIYKKEENPLILICIDMIKKNINSISEDNKNLYDILTPSEIKIAKFISLGKNTKDIADTLDIAVRTVENHRNNIRKKMGLTKNNVNLESHLSKIIKDFF